MKRATFGMIFGVVVSVAIVAWLLSQLEWSKFISALAGVNMRWIPAIVVLYVVSMFIRAIRWRYLLPSDLHVRTMKLFSAANIGVFASFVLPLRAGEFVRPWVLSRDRSVSFSRAFSSVVTERVFDVLTMLTLFALTLSGIDEPPPWVRVCVQGLSALAAVILAVMLIAYFRSDLVLRVVRACFDFAFRRAPALNTKLSEMAEEFILGLKSISSFSELLLVILLSFALWVEVSLICYVSFLCLGIDGTFAMANTVNVFIALAVAAPSAPGFIGTFHAGCVAALSEVYKLPYDLVVAYAVVLHTVQFVTGIGLGFAMLQYEGMRFAQMRVTSAENLGNA